MYVFDPFQGVAAGSGTPAGWTGPSFGSGTVEAFGSAGGGAFTPHQWFLFTGNDLTSPTFGPDASVTIWFAWKATGFTNKGTVFNTRSPAVSGPDITSCILQFEDDNTLSLYVAPGGPPNFIANTGATGHAFQAGVWYFIQVNVTLSLQNVSGTNFLKATVDLFVDGERLINQASQHSNFDIDTNFLGSDPRVNSVAWFESQAGASGLAEPYIGPGIGAGTVGYPGNLWTAVVDTPGSGYHQATTIVTVGAGTATLTPVVTAGAVTGILPFAPGFLGDSYSVAPGLTVTDSDGVPGSGATAHATLSPSPFRRVPQAVMETAALPTTANIRIPQVVIEVATLSGPPPAVAVNPGPAVGGRFIFQPVYCLVPPPGKPKYKGCGRKPDCFSIPEREWVDMVAGSIAFNPQKAILLPDPADVDVVIFSFKVPVGYDGMILGQYNTLSTFFAQGSGDIAWRIRADGRYLRDRGNITVSIGSNKRLYPVAGGLQLRSNNLVEFVVSAPNTGGSIHSPGRGQAIYVLAGLHGWFYPRK